MSAYGNGDDRSDSTGARGNRVQVLLTDEQMAAVEGWRAANRIADQADALSELVRLGLLSEIARVYRLASGLRDGFDDFHEHPAERSN